MHNLNSCQVAQFCPVDRRNRLRINTISALECKSGRAVGCSFPHLLKHLPRKPHLCGSWGAASLLHPRLVRQLEARHEVSSHHGPRDRYRQIPRFLCRASSGSRRFAAWNGRRAAIRSSSSPRPGDESAQVELTYNWDPEIYGEGRNFGHLAYEVDNIYDTCQRLMDGGRDHQPAAARRAHGFHPLARQHLHRAACRRAGRCRPRSPGPRCRTLESGRSR